MSPNATQSASAASLGLTAFVQLGSTTSTMDEVHARARAGAQAGLLVLADRQEAGRGRGGNSWTSEPGAGVWMTLLERPRDPSALRVLSLRLGLAIAEALDPFVDGDVCVKWPNDLYVRAEHAGGARKLAGILVEARWREQSVDWVAIGVGINLRAPEPSASVLESAPQRSYEIAALRPGTGRDAVLHAVVPRMRDAAAGGDTLSRDELEAWRARDISVGRGIVEPIVGTVQGITEDGALRVRTGPEAERVTQVGSIRYVDDDSPLERAP